MVFSSQITKRIHGMKVSFAYLDMKENAQLPDNVIFIQPNIEYNSMKKMQLLQCDLIHAYIPFILSLYEMQTFIAL